MAQVAARVHIARCKVSLELDSVCCRMAVYRIPRGGRRIKPECIELRIIVDTRERLNKLSSNSHPDVRQACMTITREKSRPTGLHADVHGAFGALPGRFPRSWTHVSRRSQQNASRHPQIR